MSVVLLTRPCITRLHPASKKEAGSSCTCFWVGSAQWAKRICTGGGTSGQALAFDQNWSLELWVIVAGCGTAWQ